MKKILLLFVLAILVVYYMPVTSAQEFEDYKQQKGYVDFNKFDFFKNREKKVEVSLKGPLLRFAAKAAPNDDPEVKKLLENLKAVTVDVFELDDGQSQEIESIINNLSSALKAENWERIVRVKDEGEHVEIFTLISGEEFKGLVVMVLDDKEAVFVNIVGNINPEQLGKLGGKFNIPNLTEELKKGKRKKKNNSQ